MTPEESQSDREIVRRMLAAAERRAPRPENDEVAEYDWQAPCQYLPDAIQKLQTVAADFGKRISAALGEVLRSEIELEPAGVTQHYAGRLQQSTDDPAVYFAALTSPDGGPCGLVTVPTDLAGAWVARLLGGSHANGQRELSGLETDLLLDILRTIAEGISSGSQAVGGPGFTHGQSVSTGRIDLPGEDSRVYCRFVFQLSSSQPPSQVFFLIASEAVDLILGIRRAHADASPEQMRRRLEGHLRRAPIAATLRLGGAPITMRDVMALETGDVVLLQRQVHEPVEVVLRDKAVLLANPVTCDDRYGMQIVSWADSQGPVPQPSPADRAGS